MAGNGRSIGLAGAAALLALAGAYGASAQAGGPLDTYADDALRRWPAVTAFPEYPEEQRRDRIEGETTVCFRINAEGKIVRPKVRSTTHRAFEKSAMAAIRESLFVPLAAGEVESPAEVCRAYHFRLNPIAVADAAPPGDSATAMASGSALSARIAGLAPLEPADPATIAAAARAAAESAAAGQPATAIDTASLLTAAEEDGERVCTTRKRPGSMIATTTCYSRAEQIALENAKLRVIRELEIEQQWRDHVINEARMDNAWPRGGNIGPNN